jgi:transposase-like protein
MTNPTPPEILIADYQTKIDIVDNDIKKLQADGASPRKVEALTEYKKYLEDQLKSMNHGNNS